MGRQGLCTVRTELPSIPEQLRLSGMDDAQIQEASYTILQSVGFSSYLHGMGYSLDQFLQELGAAVDYIKSQNG